MKDKYREEKLEIKRRVAEIIQDYLVSEPDEDVAVIAMYFRKGDEEQEKVLRFGNTSLLKKAKVEQAETGEEDILKQYGFYTYSELTEEDKKPWYENLL